MGVTTTIYVTIIDIYITLNIYGKNDKRLSAFTDTVSVDAFGTSSERADPFGPINI
jgi:hypothetical protein